MIAVEFRLGNLAVSAVKLNQKEKLQRTWGFLGKAEVLAYPANTGERL
jgi:hypothetical protein